MRKKQSAKNLKDISDILWSLHATHWLEGGTMLGAYRDQDFCKDDEDDVDIGVWGNYQYLIPEIIKQAEKKGFSLYRHYRDKKLKDFAQQLAFKRDNLKVDVIFYEKINENAVGGVFKKAGKGYEIIPRVVPAHFYENLADITFYKNTYRVPQDIEECLAYQYGDWQTPKHRSTYSCYNPEDLKSLKPDYVLRKN